MLTIVDLHQEEELSSSDMRKVAGGNVISNIVQIANQQRADSAGSSGNGLKGESLESNHKDWIE